MCIAGDPATCVAWVARFVVWAGLLIKADGFIQRGEIPNESLVTTQKVPQDL
jgi:hypothetical protein